MSVYTIKIYTIYYDKKKNKIYINLTSKSIICNKQIRTIPGVINDVDRDGMYDHAVRH